MKLREQACRQDFYWAIAMDGGNGAPGPAGASLRDLRGRVFAIPSIYSIRIW